MELRTEAELRQRTTSWKCICCGRRKKEPERELCITCIAVCEPQVNPELALLQTHEPVPTFGPHACQAS